MSGFKTIVSARRLPQLDINLLSDADRQDVERELDFIPADRLRSVMELIGQDRLVHIAGRSWKQVSRYLRGDRIPSDVLTAVADDIGVSIDWLAKGQLRTATDAKLESKLLHSKVGSRIIAAKHPHPEPMTAKIMYGLKIIYDRLDALDTFVPSEEQIPASNKADTPVSSDDFVRLPVYAGVVASAGHGSIPVAEYANNVIAFAKGFLRDLGGNPDSCSIIFSRGTSMKPTIPDGSILVVDHNQRDVAHGCIYVFNVSDRLLVKRARWRMDGRLELVSDNTDEGYPVETFGPEAVDDLRVVGRVVYFCRTP